MLASHLTGCGNDPATTAGGNEDTGTDGTGDDMPPEMTELPTLEPLSETEIRLTWAPGSDDVTDESALGYNVYRSLTPDGFDFAAAPAAALTGGVTTVDIAGVSPAQLNYFVVRAVDELGQESDNTEAVSGETADVTAPEFMGLDLLEANDQGGLTATWTAATDNVSAAGEIVYDVYLSTESQPQNDEANLLVTTAPGETSVDVLDEVDEVVAYWMVVRARDVAGNTEGNVVARTATTLDVTAPTFGGVETAQVLGGNVVLGWTAATDTYNAPEELVYAIYVQEGTEVTDFTSPQLTVPGAESYIFESGMTDTAYAFVVRARDEAGNESENVELAQATTASSLDGTPPEMSPVLIVEAVSATTLSLSWDAGTDNETALEDLRYGAWISTTPAGHDFGVAPALLTAAGVQSGSLTGLNPQTAYYVVVRALDLANNWSENVTPQSDITFADTTPPVCTGIGLTATATSSTTVLLEWNMATDDVTASSALTYRVYQSDSAATVYDGAPIASVNATAGPTESYTVAGLSPDQLVYFGVRAVDGYNLTCDNLEAASTTVLADTTAPTFGGITSATPVDETSVALTWSPITDDDVHAHAEVIYVAYWGAAGSLFTTPVGTLNAGAGTTGVTVTGLAPNQQYAFGVRSQDPAPYSNEDSNTVEISAATLPDLDAPSVPGAILTTTATSGTLDWSANLSSDPNDVTAQGDLVYEVCGGTCLLASPQQCTSDISTFTQNCEWYVNNPVSGVFEPAAPVSTAAGATGYDIASLEPGVQIYYQVRACDQSSNCSAWGAWLYGVTQVDGVPPAEGVIQSAVPTSPSTIDLTWTAGSDDVTVPSNLVYRVFAAETGQAFDFGGAPASGPTTAGALTATVSGLVRDTAYDFVVQSRDTAGNWSVNTAVQGSATTLADTTPPGASPVTAAVAASCLTIDVTFDTTTDDGVSPDLIEYQICASLAVDGCDDANFATNLVGTVTGLDGSVTSHTEMVTVAEPGDWNVRVRAQDDVPNLNVEAASLAVGLVDTGSPVFSGPITVTANYGSTWQTSLTADWSADVATDACSDDASITYEVCVRNLPTVGCALNSDFVAAEPPSTATSTTLVDHPDIPSNSQVNLFVRAIDEAGNISAPVAAFSAKSGVSFATDVDPIFSTLDNTQGGCNNSCHGGVNAELMSASGNWTYANTVTTALLAKCPTTSTWEYVVAGDPENSLLWVHTQDPSYPHPDGCVAGQMPSAGVFDPAIQNTLYDWILQGAFNN